MKRPPVRLILIDAPSGARRLVDEKGARLLSHLPCIPTPKWFRRLWFNQFRGFKLRMPVRDTNLTDMEKYRLQIHCKRCAIYPLD